MSPIPSPPASGEHDEAGSDRRYALIGSAVADLEHATSAYQAELLVSAVLGSLYTVATAETDRPLDRRVAVEEFAAGFRRYLERRDDLVSVALRAVLASLLGRPEAIAASPPGLDWLDQLGAVGTTGAFRYDDGSGDQETYLVTFAYRDPVAGGPDHAVVVLVDRDLGTVRDLFVAAPAAAVVERLRSEAETDPAASFTEISPVQVGPAVAGYLTALDRADTLPDDDAFCTDWAVVVARLGPLGLAADRAGTSRGQASPDGSEADTRCERFRASVEAQKLVGAPGDASSLAFCLDLIERFAATRPDHDALRWSPRAVERFLLVWVPRYALLDDTDRALLPRVLDAWVRWAGRVRGAAPAAVARTVLAVVGCRSRFLTRSRDLSLRGPETRAVAAMLAAGVDPDDQVAVARWIANDSAGIDPPV
jgi:hypothetical protein